MHLLSFDTTQGVTSITLAMNNQIMETFSDDTPNNQASQLVTQIQQIMERHTCRWEMLDGVACVTGPGGFTSVRIGVATARALAFAANIPAYGIPLAELMAYYAYHAHGVEEICCRIPAGRRDYITQHYAVSNNSPQATTAMALTPRNTFNSDLTICTLSPETDNGDVIFPLEQAAGLLTQMMLSLSDHATYLTPEPLYAKPADAKIGKPLLPSQQHSG